MCETGGLLAKCGLPRLFVSHEA